MASSAVAVDEVLANQVHAQFISALAADVADVADFETVFADPFHNVFEIHAALQLQILAAYQNLADFKLGGFSFSIIICFELTCCHLHKPSVQHASWFDNDYLAI